MAMTERKLDRGWLGALSTVSLLLMSAVGLFELRVHTSLHGFESKAKDVFSAGRHPERPDITIRSRYTGIGGVDNALSFIVAMFLPGAIAFNDEQQVQMAYFLLTIFSVIAVFSVEAFRSGSRRAWISYTSIAAVLYQSIGGAVIIPIWFLLFVRYSTRLSLYEPSSIRVPQSYAKALVPSHILGYLLPTVAIFVPLNDPGFSTRQALVAFWQTSPIYVNILMVILAQVYSATSQQAMPPDSDVRYIKTLHACCFMTSLVTHASLLYRWTQSTWSLADIFVPRASSLQGSIADGLYYVFQVDFAICYMATILATYIAVMDLKRLKRCDLSPVMVGASIVVASFLIGPAATISAAWWWREEKLRSDGKKTSKGKRL